jgi:quinol-cytochrome oxidoreductase complex cytochrome b subunit
LSCSFSLLLLLLLFVEWALLSLLPPSYLPTFLPSYLPTCLPSWFLLWFFDIFFFHFSSNKTSSVMVW